MLKKLFILFAILQLSACAFSDSRLNIDYAPQASAKGVISSVSTKKIQIKTPQDGRANREVIGYKRNAYGMNTADIFSQRPVPEIVSSALATMFESNGHNVLQRGNAIIETNITKFWFDMEMGLVTLEFKGDVALDLKVRDRSSNKILFSQKFNGHHTEETMMGLEESWTRVMNNAMEDLMRKIMLSSKLKTALSKVR